MDGFNYYSTTPYAYVPAMASTGGVFLCQSPCPFEGMCWGYPGHPPVSQFPNVNQGYPGHGFGMGPEFGPIQFISPPYPIGGMLTSPQLQFTYPSAQPTGPDWNSNNLIPPPQYKYAGTMDASGLFLQPGPPTSQQDTSDGSTNDQLVTTGASSIPINPTGNEGQPPLFPTPELDASDMSTDQTQQGPNGQQWNHDESRPQGVTVSTDQFVDPRGIYHKSVPITRNGVRLSRKKPKRKFGCGFCLSNKETYTFCTSHQLKDAQGQVTCPILQALICPICGQTGKSAHTIRYCPANPPNQSQPPAFSQFQLSRNSAGERLLLRF